MAEPIEQPLLRLAVAQKHLDQATADQVAAEAAASATAVADLLLAKGLVTKHGLDLLQAEVARAKQPPTIGGCRIDQRLGQGGMGTVYRAYQLSMERHVALKVLSQDLQKKKGFAERFLREAQAVAKVSHPNVVGCFDTGQDQGSLYMVLELMEGGDAERLMREQGGRLLPKRAIEIVRDAAHGVEALHAVGLVHRDLKPANLFLDAEGHTKIGDLGLARSEDGEDRMTKTGVAMGTPAYMSPEQAKGEVVLDVRSDLYALGATLYTLLTGQQPFTGASPYAIVNRVINEPVPNPRTIVTDLPESALQLMRKAMAKDPNRRHQTPAEFVVACDAAIAALNDPQPMQSRHSGRRSTATSNREPAVGQHAHDGARKGKGRRPAWVLPAIIGGVLLVIGAVVIVALPGPTTDTKSPTASATLVPSLADPVPVGSDTLAADAAAAASFANASVDDLQPKVGAGWGVAEADRWCQLMAKLKADEQLPRVIKALSALNPGVKPEQIHGTIFEDRVILIEVASTAVSDLRPLAGIPRLAALRVTPIHGSASPLENLRPLADVALAELHIPDCQVADLSPVKGKALTAVTLLGTPASDIRPVINKSLKRIAFDPRQVKDGMKELRAQGGIQIILPLGTTMSAGDFWRRWDRDKLQPYFSSGGKVLDPK